MYTIAYLPNTNENINLKFTERCR